MRVTFVFLFCILLYVAKCFSTFNTSPTPFPSFNNVYSEENRYPKKHQIEINIHNILQIFTLAFGSFISLWLSLLQLCNHVRYVSFDTNLSTCGKGKAAKSPACFWTFLYLIILG